MNRSTFGRGRFVGGFFAGIAAAVLVGLAWPGASQAAPAPRGALAPIGGAAVETAQCQENAAEHVAQEMAAAQASAADRRAGGILSMFFPFLDARWPALVELGAEAEHMQTAIDRAFLGTWTGGSGFFELARGFGRGVAWPRITLREQPDAYHVHIDAPDAEHADVKVSVQGNRVTVSYADPGAAPPDREAHEPSTPPIRSERFEETMTLAHRIDGEQVVIDRRGDALDVTLPKTEQHS